jgi:hypothetical protein
MKEGSTMTRAEKDHLLKALYRSDEDRLSQQLKAHRYAVHRVDWDHFDNAHRPVTEVKRRQQFCGFCHALERRIVDARRREASLG